MTIYPRNFQLLYLMVSIFNWVLSIYTSSSLISAILVPSKLQCLRRCFILNMAEELHIFNYDVFISFRGEDTRHTFVKILHKELKRKGIRTFVDDEMLKAENDISPALSKAIEESMVLIIVLSENYASSRWCLDELVKILECSRKGNQQLVYPIFYHVDPSHVCHQTGKYGEAMAAHENRFGIDFYRIRAWRSALNEVCQLKGHHISTGNENNIVEEIVKNVSKIVYKPFHGKDPVGFEQRIEEVKSLLDMKLDDDTVCMLGIYGLGGIGKTEIAKALFSKIVHKFEAASFIENVREKSNNIIDLQKTLLSDMFEVLETELNNTSRGICEIKSRLGKKKILLVLDDVDDREQLDNLAGGCDWFGSGSRIIITSRDEHLLHHHGVQKTYKMVELNDQQSLELFCHNAFGKSHPKSGYEVLSSRAVNYAKGLPLALKVLGSDLATEENLEDWEWTLEEFKMNRNPLIQDVLQRSYESLDYNAKQVFLDIACFFKGERIEYVENILKEFYAPRTIKLLVHKSLLTIEDGCLNMNGLIQDMAREIVRREAPNNPGKRSRLWSHEDIIEVLTENKGTDAVEGIMLNCPQKREVEWSGTTFMRMKHLRILIVRNASFTTELRHLPNHLRVLDWEEYPSKSFPQNFYPKKIIVFNLGKSYLTLEEPFKKFSNLTIMNFSDNQSITEMPSVSEVPNLIEIRLDNCKNLIKVHESVGLLQKLAHLSALGCTKLKVFLQSMYLPSLEVLDLNLCIRLEHFPDILNNMNQPLKIYMINTAIEELPDSIGNLIGLVSIEMTGSRKLKYLPHSLFMLKNVVNFKIGGCSNLGESFRNFAHSTAAANGRSALKTLYFGNGGLVDEDLDAILNCFPELVELTAWENNFVSLPECIKETVHLTSLDVSDCRELRKIPECTSLRILTVHHCVKLEEISELPSTIQKVDARYCCSLTTETLDMLWSQVKKEIQGLEVVMHPTKVPKWFDYRENEGNPYFWACGKFPIIALALFFSKKGAAKLSRRQLVELHLVINGQFVPRKGSYNFRMEAEHVLVCDLRLLFSEEEWQGLDALLVHDWNLVQVSYEASSTMTLSSWGVYVYKQETNIEDVQFMCPGPEYSDIANISRPRKVPSRDSDDEQELRKMAEEFGLDNMHNEMLKELIMEEPGDDFEDKDGTPNMPPGKVSARHVLQEQEKMVEELSLEDTLNAMLIGMDLDEQNDDNADKDYVVKKQIHFLMAFGEEISRILQTNMRLEDKEMKPPVEVDEDSTSGHQWNYSSHEAPPHSVSTKMVAPGSDDDPFLQEGYESEAKKARKYSDIPNIPPRIVPGLEDHMFDGMLKKKDLEEQGYFADKDDAVQQMQDPWGKAKDVLEDRLLNDNSSHLAYWLLQRFDAGEASTSEQQQSRNDVSESTLARILQFIRSPMELGEPLGQETVDMDELDKRYWKLMEEHRALREKFEEFENETATGAAPDELDSWKHQYHELMEKLNSTAHQSAEYYFTSIKHDDEELGALLTARDEELKKLYDYSKKCQDVKSAIYLNGLRDGLLAAHAISLALDMDETMDPLLDIPSTAGLAPSVHSFRSCFSSLLACLFMTDS